MVDALGERRVALACKTSSRTDATLPTSGCTHSASRAADKDSSGPGGTKSSAAGAKCNNKESMPWRK